LLSLIIEAGVPSALALEAWVGPLDGIQDFEIGTGAIEVKATLSAVGFPARIGSLEQLDDSVRQPLFLAGIRLRQISNGKNLPDFISELRQSITGDAEAERLLSERLIAAGYFADHADRYPRRFDVVSTRIVEVTEGFPRLTPGRVPQGISKALYEIDFDRAPGVNIGTTEALKKLEAI
ncbi:MAG: PD-(D/E)XK motif protein, partial [Candidatus Methylopumilus sp.]|nr:PD-(D/E)XK motif protein [Candidatus Methylopumilus sp.]